jgi:hypothetical protein
VAVDLVGMHNWLICAATSAFALGGKRDLDRLQGLRMIGIDEKSWGKGAGKYLTVVTDHATGRSPGSPRVAARTASGRSSTSSGRRDRNC